jgi:hypothetical protein
MITARSWQQTPLPSHLEIALPLSSQLSTIIILSTPQSLPIVKNPQYMSLYSWIATAAWKISCPSPSTIHRCLSPRFIHMVIITLHIFEFEWYKWESARGRGLYVSTCCTSAGEGSIFDHLPSGVGVCRPRPPRYSRDSIWLRCGAVQSQLPGSTVTSLIYYTESRRVPSSISMSRMGPS